jgi:8-hydroxy-5-deazaflavin:NADPH oxidoreductase
VEIAIIGPGSVGGQLARGWARKGHKIMFGARDPGGTGLAPLLKETGGTALRVADAVKAAEVVVLATPWGATLDLVSQLDLAGKVVVDATNPLLPDLGGLAVGRDTSGAEEVQKAARGAKVVKCFNTTGANNYLAPSFPGGTAAMLYCGDDAGAKARVRTLGADLGFDMIDVGPLVRARLLEPLALLWITLAYPQGMGREIAFGLLRR